MADSNNSTSPRVTRARDLLRRVVADNVIPLDDLAHELVVTPRMLGEFLSGAIEMPLNRQLYLALLVIQRAPALARRGYSLRGQVIAAMALDPTKRTAAAQQAAVPE